jgi:hypothetical protein
LFPAGEATVAIVKSMVDEAAEPPLGHVQLQEAAEWPARATPLPPTDG